MAYDKGTTGGHYAQWFYDSKSWRTVRNAYFQEKLGICEECGHAGEIVHHKIWLNPSNINDVNITLNKDNLEVVCRSCHNLIHEGVTATANRLKFDENGNLIQVEREEHAKDNSV